MSLKFHVIMMTVLAVISDAILIPFYPQFFSARYGIDSAVHVGAYVAAISIAVMCTLPLWARVARRIEPLHLLVYTQFAAGTFSLLCDWAPDVQSYWVLSMLMFMCKSSYLLMYPYMMRLTPKDQHAATIGVLSVVVHFGAIFGAVVGGFVLQAWGPRASIFAMAAGDFFQMAVCIYLIRSGKIVRINTGEHAQTAAAAAEARRVDWRARLPILRLALVMLLFDFSAYLIRPFFAVYWQKTSGYDSELVSGMAFAIPGVVAIVALRLHAHIRARSGRLPDHTVGNLLLGMVGLLLHAAPDPVWIVVGRVLYGWSLFQIIVKLEVNLFRLSTPQRYAQDYSITNFFQNLGVLLSSFAAGAIVERYGLHVPFLLAAGGFVLTALLDRLILNVPSADHAAPLEAPAHAN
ncbi:MFS transporter [Variovorax sp. J22G21]|uniref:MFS transporter n=1 Tax=Variovorax fucosicus TaxID=3053517 RepID=UPI0025765FD6|nr:MULTISPECIES: MFS transporter [unclassified Variovorax]MDM0037581.1 MFS transporter [Variovorax sp. J22R193]MDM0062357.1 MFS transporter [Variovorax sp. J22G21]